MGFRLAAPGGARCATLLVVTNNNICYATAALGFIDPLIIVVAWFREFCNNVPCMEKTWDVAKAAEKDVDHGISRADATFDPDRKRREENGQKT